MRNWRIIIVASALGMAQGSQASDILQVARAGTGVSPNTQSVSNGKALYARHCAACHGPQGEGQAGWEKLNERGELPAPPHDAKGHTWKHSDAMLYRITKDGWRDPFNATAHKTMPAFGATLAPSEIRTVINYLKTMWTPAQRRTQRDESQREPFPAESK